MTEGYIKCLVTKCVAKFWSEIPMKQHLTKFHKMTKKEIHDKCLEFKKIPVKMNCPGCDAIFWNKITLKKHVKDKCMPEKLVCTFCDGIFWNRVTLKKHVVINCKKKKDCEKSQIEEESRLEERPGHLSENTCKIGISKLSSKTNLVSKNSDEVDSTSSAEVESDRNLPENGKSDTEISENFQQKPSLHENENLETNLTVSNQSFNIVSGSKFDSEPIKSVKNESHKKRRLDDSLVCLCGNFFKTVEDLSNHIDSTEICQSEGNIRYLKRMQKTTSNGNDRKKPKLGRKIDVIEKKSAVHMSEKEIDSKESKDVFDFCEDDQIVDVKITRSPRTTKPYKVKCINWYYIPTWNTYFHRGADSVRATGA